MGYALGSLVSGLVLPRLESAYAPELSAAIGEFGIPLSVTSAQSVLSAVASGMMALTAIVFSIAYITVQFNSVAYSPRLALWLARDPVLFHTFGIFIWTFLYALETLGWVDRGGSGSVPRLSILLVAVLLMISMILFARLVRGLSDLQVTNTLQTVGAQGREVIRAMFAEHREKAASELPKRRRASRTALGPVTQMLQYAGEPRTITRFDIAALVSAAEAAGAVIVMDCAVGDTLVSDEILLRVHGAGQRVPDAALTRAIHLAPERTFEQDPKYAIRLLVDIAIKALSPAVNDPTTAVQALDQIEDLLRRLAHMELDAGYACDALGELRLIFPMPSWEDYLRLSFDEIRQYGAASVQVMRRLRAALVGVEQSLSTGKSPEEERLGLVRRYIEHLDAVIKRRSDLDAQDRVIASQEDRQGIGQSRKSPDSTSLPRAAPSAEG
jgi:uncharacterized membrane protein